VRRTPARSAAALAATTTAALAAALLATPAQAGPPVDPAGPASFTRVDLDTGVAGAAITVTGSGFGTEQNLVTSAFGAYGPPTGGPPSPPDAGTVQVYRPGATIGDWTKVPVLDESAAITFPNQPTLADVDGDGDTDVVVPGGYFFDTYEPVPGTAKNRGSITWWENTGADPAFVRHDVLTAQPWAFHGVQLADLDDDGNDDIITVGEQGKSPSDPADDLVTLLFLAGNGDGTFDPPVTLADAGGSLPVVHDVDGDGRLDIVSAQYFGFPNGPGAVTMPSFMWFQQTGDLGAGGLDASNFSKHTIATFADTAYGFQIRPVPDLHGDGNVGWVGTNHMSKAGPGGAFIPASESVYEFTPGAVVTDPWAVTRLSNPIDAADKIAARKSPGSAAPGVLGYGDIDGDGDIDLAVSGDGDELVVDQDDPCIAANSCDRRLFWIEQRGDGSFRQHTLTAPGERFGQAGGAVVADLDGDGANELAFSSFEQNTLAVWTRQGGGAPAVVAATKIKGFKTTTKKVKKSKTVKDTIKVVPGHDRSVTLQFRTCKPSADCHWKKYSTHTTNKHGKAKLKYKAKGKKSYWRVKVAGTASAHKATSGVRKLIRR
jgi:hypothetical protein